MCQLCDEERLYAMYQAHVRAETEKSARREKGGRPASTAAETKKSAPIDNKPQQ